MPRHLRGGKTVAGIALDPEQKELADLERKISEDLTGLRDDVDEIAGGQNLPAIDPEYVKRWGETARRVPVQVSNDLPPQLEPEAVAEARKIIVNLLDGLGRVDPARPLDALDR